MKAIVTVLGKDQVGIIAAVCTLLADNNVNVLDISQTILQDYFTMVMLVDANHCDLPFAELAALLEQEGQVNGALKTTKKLLEDVPPSSTGTLPGVSASEADKVGRNDLIKSRAFK